ncbi:hypothetical protein K505DRAFT_389008 [Melanomma pulvis-pyrius CBS 109.77]|uniref:Uncharacterized protein n=1 Tax=Melanomma pulvis-pyrius CBS 109.77 TaxID=1314802 RepID=A0A6A6XSI7_9PLEO|nr:hypothetical protein K505DRAFT_389008 [Melanomma pulvis-pyrius CBS 109.77]
MSTEATPISPPQDPMAPVARAASFPHKTSASTPPTHAYIETSTPAINAVAVELDSVAIATHGEKSGGIEGAGEEGEEKKEGGLRGIVGGLKKTLLGRKEGEDEGKKDGGNVGLGEQEDNDDEFLGGGGKAVGREVREKRAALLSTRSKDPGVIVDVPQDPTAEEVQAAKSAEGTVTPAVPASEGEAVTLR